MRLYTIIFIMIINVVLATPAVAGDILQGKVEKDGKTENDIKTKIDTNTVSSRPASLPSLPSVPNDSALASFAQPPAVPQNNNQNNFSLQAFAQAPSSSEPKGTSDESEEMTLAWEKWHKQFMATIYKRIVSRMDRTDIGTVTMDITVTRDRQLTCEITSSTGTPTMPAYVEDAAMSMSYNQGLTFPPGSQREVVHFTRMFKSGYDVIPGYHWDKNDFEHIVINH